jgi:nucleotide-binding universal stress UspA family protein
LTDFVAVGGGVSEREQLASERTSTNRIRIIGVLHATSRTAGAILAGLRLERLEHPLQHGSIMKILVATDFSPDAKAATRVAIRLAADLNAELVIAHAWHVPSYGIGIEPYLPDASLVQRIADETQRELDTAVHEAKSAGAKSIAGTLLTGQSPWARIVDVAEADPAVELIVMGTHGRTGVRRVLLGSVAEKVARHAPCSVLVVRGEPPPFKDVLCPVDFSRASRHATDLATRLVHPGGSGITLLHVIEAPVSYTGEAYPAEFLRGLDTAGAKALDGLAEQLRSRLTVPVTTRTRLGFAGSQTLAVLDGDPAHDLVVMGSHGRTGLRRALLGSVAEKLVRHAPCSVLIARDRA